MGQALIAGGGNVGVTSDELTANIEDVLEDRTYVGADTNDEAGTGGMPYRGQYQYAGGWGSGSDYFSFNNIPEGCYRAEGQDWAPEIRVNKDTFYQWIGYTDPSKVWDGYTIAGKKGTMKVPSVVSFSVASVSGVTFTLRWQNPSKGPYGGVIIRVKEGSYPTSVTDGSQAYKGVGTNKNLNGISTCTWTASKQNTTYYFRIWMYCDISSSSMGTQYSGYLQTSGKTGTLKGQQTFTSSGYFTVPNAVYSIQYFIVGAGAGSFSSYSFINNSGNGVYKGSPGGGSGYTKTGTLAVTPGQRINVTIGMGGIAVDADGERGYANNGGSTSFGSNTVEGGKGARWDEHISSNDSGGEGGSGGGDAYIQRNGNYTYFRYPGSGGSDGSDGGNARSSGGAAQSFTGASGQGTTTRAFGQSNGTLYAGGGAGAHHSHSDNYDADHGAVGGAGGGGDPDTNGTPNTGGGAGGGRYGSGRTGGSGICLVRWGY